jgi:hypothetical protein
MVLVVQPMALLQSTHSAIERINKSMKMRDAIEASAFSQHHTV